MSILEATTKTPRARRRWFRNPPNAVPDIGIDLKRKIIPINVLEPIEAPAVRGFAIPALFKPYLVPRELPTLADIFEETRKFYKLSKMEFGSNRRLAPLVHARQVAMHLCRKLTLRSFPEIGRALLKDHTSILHGAKKIARLADTDERLADEIQIITIRINERLAARNVAAAQGVVRRLDMFDCVDIREW